MAGEAPGRGAQKWTENHGLKIIVRSSIPLPVSLWACVEAVYAAFHRLRVENPQPSLPEPPQRFRDLFFVFGINEHRD